jgi:hypothetical protein
MKHVTKEPHTMKSGHELSPKCKKIAMSELPKSHFLEKAPRIFSFTLIGWVLP